jgi:hypothetical protein
MYVFTSDGETLVLHSSRAGRWSAPRPFASMSGGALPFTSPGVLGRLFVDGEGARIWFCDERWRMHCADLPTLTVNREGGQVVAWGSLLQGSGVAFVQRSRDDRLELRTRSPKGGGTDVLGGRAFRLSRGFVVAVTRAGVPSFVALGAGDGEWQLLAPSGRTDKLLRLSADLPVYGAALIGAQQCLLVGDRAREMLNFVDGERVVSSVTLPDEVDFACLHSNGHWIAAQVAGGLCVVDRRGRELLRWGGPWL